MPFLLQLPAQTNLGWSSIICHCIWWTMVCGVWPSSPEDRLWRKTEFESQPWHSLDCAIMNKLLKLCLYIFIFIMDTISWLSYKVLATLSGTLKFLNKCKLQILFKTQFRDFCFWNIPWLSPMGMCVCLCARTLELEHTPSSKLVLHIPLLCTILCISLCGVSQSTRGIYLQVPFLFCC